MLWLWLALAALRCRYEHLGVTYVRQVVAKRCISDHCVLRAQSASMAKKTGNLKETSASPMVITAAELEIYKVLLLLPSVCSV